MEPLALTQHKVSHWKFEPFRHKTHLRPPAEGTAATTQFTHVTPTGEESRGPKWEYTQCKMIWSDTASFGVTANVL